MTEENMETTNNLEEEVSASAATIELEIDDVEEEHQTEEEEEEEEEDEEEEEEEIEDEDEDYELRFEGEMNPLDFIEDNALGVQPYQQFERLEYEALAERKRKALSDRQSDGSAKKSRKEDAFTTSFDEIMEGMSFGKRRKSRKLKKRGRKKGSKNKLSPGVSRKLGKANMFYAKGQYEEAIRVLNEVVMLAPNLSETYHTLGLVYEETGDKKKAMSFYMLAAHLAPKDHFPLWNRLADLSREEGSIRQAAYCLSKAISADPENVEVRKKTAKMYLECNQVERSIGILEKYIKDYSTEADLSVVVLLVDIHMKHHAYIKALQQIEQARSVHCSGEHWPFSLTVMEGICRVRLGNIEEAEILFRDLQMELVGDHAELITEVAHSFMKQGHYEKALKYYFMLEENGGHINAFLLKNIAQCYLSLKERAQAITFFYKALHAMEDNIDTRLTLARLLLEEGKENESIELLSPPKHLESTTNRHSMQSKSWWASGSVKMQLAQIYHAKGELEDFVGTIISSVRETLSIESLNQKVKTRKKLPTSILKGRAKMLDDHHADDIFCGFRPIATPSDMLKATRAKKLLQKKVALKEEKKAAALAAGLDWHSDDSDDEPPRQALRELPLPKLLKDDEHYRLILNLCKALASLRRYWEALEIIKHTLRLACNTLSLEKKEELQSLEAQMAYKTTDRTCGYDCARDTVQQHPDSFAAWNYYYKAISRLENKLSKHSKFLRRMRSEHTKCVSPMIIFGHQLTLISQHQAAAREYLEAYKLQPDSPLINLCVGTALINLALGFRLQNKHQCLVQGLAFLQNNMRLCENSQEALYNIARAYQHVGLVTLAASYYEKVLAIHEKDYPIPKLPKEDSSLPDIHKPGHCDLRREAAYNLHLIYKKSGALDLARQVLKDHCTP